MSVSEVRVCTPKRLPPHQQQEAADVACAENPCNRPALERLAGVWPGYVPHPAHLAVLTTKWWGAKGVSLPVKFLEPTPAALRNKILAYANNWGKYANVKFSYSQSGAGIRLTRDMEGYWSYLGTDLRSIPLGQPTLCLQGFGMDTPDSEYARVVQHEFGHAIGCPHEHCRDEIVALLDRAKTIAYFAQTQGWTEDEIVAQVLTPISRGSTWGTAHADGTSIMCYQIPGACTVSGNPVPGGLDLDAQDRAFIGTIYPKRK